MKKRTIFLFVILAMLSSLLSGCTPVEGYAPSEWPFAHSITFVPTSTPTPVPTATNTPSPTNTPVPTDVPVTEPTSTRMPLPTIVKHQPTPTVERPVEWDINPFFEKRIDTEWMGVRIKASIIIDESLKDEIESIEMMDSLLAEIVARTVFVVWYSQHSSVVWDAYYSSASGNRWLVYGDNEFHSYMDLWSKAQKSGDSSDWSKVQINNIWANDLSDGNGYHPQPYNFWPMYEGENVPANIRAIQRFTFVFTGYNASKNLAMVRKSPNSTAPPSGYGKNFGNGDFSFVIGRSRSKDIFGEGASLHDVKSHLRDVLYFKFCFCAYTSIFIYNEEYIDLSTSFYDENMYKSIQYWGIKLNLILD